MEGQVNQETSPDPLSLYEQFQELTKLPNTKEKLEKLREFLKQNRLGRSVSITTPYPPSDPDPTEKDIESAQETKDLYIALPVPGEKEKTNYILLTPDGKILLVKSKIGVTRRIKHVERHDIQYSNAAFSENGKLICEQREQLTINPSLLYTLQQNKFLFSIKSVSSSDNPEEEQEVTESFIQALKIMEKRLQDQPTLPNEADHSLQ
jgi:hypothetical protein